GGAKRLGVEVGERGEALEEPFHPGGGERDQHLPRFVAQALPGMREAARDEHERAGPADAPLLPELPSKLALEHVDRLVLPGVDVERWPVTRSRNCLHRRKCPAGLLAPDDEGDVSAQWTANTFARSRCHCDANAWIGHLAPP